LKLHYDTVQTTPTTTDLRPLASIPRILVVDGNDDTRELYRQSFQLSGCDVVEASDGRDALAKALVSPPSLIVTEITLPFLDGFALMRNPAPRPNNRGYPDSGRDGGTSRRHGPRTKSRSRYRGRQTDDA
jgi:CheY-like chemotaxis protein